MESAIPDWKKGAVVITDEKLVEEKTGILGKVKGKVANKISNT